MIGQSFATGSVTRVSHWEKTDQKDSFTTVGLLSEEYYSPKAGGPPQLRKDYVTVLSYGSVAEAMKDLAVGDTIAVAGKPQAGRPYSKKDNEGNINWYSSLELRVSGWELTGCANGGAAEAGKLEEPVEETETEVSPADGETDPFAGDGN
jgi:hypothetical protein